MSTHRTSPACAYPHAVDLPFNASAIRGQFTPGTPDQDDPGLPGYWLLLQGDAVLVRLGAVESALPEGVLPPAVALAEPPLAMGSWRGKPLRVARVKENAPVPAPWTAVPINFREEILDDTLITLAAMARQILHWTGRSAKCPACCTAMERIGRTWGMRCATCRTEYFPPIHPAVIVLVRRGEEFLLARKAAWPAGQYALVAGYLEFGESLEECVVREVREETGILVRDVRYVCSQNWPFPSQIMAGFTAEYAGGEIAVDTDELEDARWFSPDDLPPFLSPRRSISRYIIETCALGREPG
jgi:NAD+ diphosphatase